MAQVAKDFMVKNPITLKKGDTIGDAVEIFGHRGVGSLPIVDEEGRPVGFLSDGDIIDYVVRNVRHRTKTLNTYSGILNLTKDFHIDCFAQYLHAVVDHSAYDCATHHVMSVDVNDNVREVSRLMQKRHLKHIPVTENGKLVGVVTRNDIIRGLFVDYLRDPDAVCVEGGQDDDF